MSGVCNRAAVFVFLLSSLIPLPAFPQDAASPYLFLDDWTYDLLDYWANNSAAKFDFVLNQPYKLTNVRENVPAADPWAGMVGEYYDRVYASQGEAKFGLYARDNLSLVTDDELPLRKGLSAAPIERVALFDNRSKNHFNVAVQLQLLLPHFALVNRTLINSEFKDDPLFPGDTGEWIYGRINDAYVNVNAGGIDLFVGRTDRNWGTPNAPGLILSGNPYSYDQVQFSYTAEKLKLSMLVTRLEDLLGVDSQSTAPDSLVKARKFMTAHRLDVALSNRFQFALSEIALYGGPDRDFEPGFLNPANAFYVVQRNNGQQINGLWALDIFAKPHPKLNLFAQFLLDDLIVNNEPGQDDRARFPDRLGLALRLSEADLIVKGVQSGIEYTRLSNRTYQSFRTWENFHYRGKSMGYPAASVEKVRLFLNYYGWPSLILRWSGSFERAGEVRVTEVFPPAKEDFPVDTVARTWETNLNLRYFLNPSVWTSFSLGYEAFRNYRHVAADDRSNLKVVVGAHVNLFSQLHVE